MTHLDWDLTNDDFIPPDGLRKRIKPIVLGLGCAPRRQEIPQIAGWMIRARCFSNAGGVRVTVSLPATSNVAVPVT